MFNALQRMVELHRFCVNQHYLVDGELVWEWPPSLTTLRYDLEPVGTKSEVHQHQRTFTYTNGGRQWSASLQSGCTGPFSYLGLYCALQVL